MGAAEGGWAWIVGEGWGTGGGEGKAAEGAECGCGAMGSSAEWACGCHGAPWSCAQADEAAALVAEREEAERRLQRERRVLDKQGKALLKLPNKKERDAMEALEAVLAQERSDARCVHVLGGPGGGGMACGVSWSRG